MLTPVLPFPRPGFVVEHVATADATRLMAARARTPAAACPHCPPQSARVHRRSTRRLRALPVAAPRGSPDGRESQRRGRAGTRGCAARDPGGHSSPPAPAPLWAFPAPPAGAGGTGGSASAALSGGAAPRGAGAEPTTDRPCGWRLAADGPPLAPDRAPATRAAWLPGPRKNCSLSPLPPDADRGRRPCVCRGPSGARSCQTRRGRGLAHRGGAVVSPLCAHLALVRYAGAVCAGGEGAGSCRPILAATCRMRSASMRGTWAANPASKAWLQS